MYILAVNSAFPSNFRFPLCQRKFQSVKGLRPAIRSPCPPYPAHQIIVVIMNCFKSITAAWVCLFLCNLLCAQDNLVFSPIDRIHPDIPGPVMRGGMELSTDTTGAGGGSSQDSAARARVNALLGTVTRKEFEEKAEKKTAQFTDYLKVLCDNRRKRRRNSLII